MAKTKKPPTPRCSCTYHDTGGSTLWPCSSEAAEDFLPTPDVAKQHDEIKRLRAEVERLETQRLDDHAKLYAAIGDRDAARTECERLRRLLEATTDQSEEVERLTRELDRYSHDRSGAIELAQREDEILRLRLEVKALRDATGEGER